MWMPLFGRREVSWGGWDGVDGRMDGQMDGWRNGWMEGGRDGWTGG